MAKRCLSCGRVSYALAVRRKPSDIAAARVIDSRGVAGCRLAADELAARIVGRRHVSVRRRATSRSAAAIAERRGVAVRRCAADTLAAAVIVRGRVSARDRAVGRSPNTVLVDNARPSVVSGFGLTIGLCCRSSTNDCGAPCIATVLRASPSH